MCVCGDMGGCWDVEMLRCEHLGMWGLGDVGMCECGDVR